VKIKAISGRPGNVFYLRLLLTSVRSATSAVCHFLTTQRDSFIVHDVWTAKNFALSDPFPRQL